MTRWRFGLLVGLGVWAGCGPAPRPTGLPPPEYEEPRVEPWTPASATPATAGAAPAAPPDPVPEPVVPAPGPAAPPENTGGSGATLPAGTPGTP
jgi:hypothetical protein